MSRTRPHVAAHPANRLPARLFHGTAEPFDGAPAPGGYDGVLWTASSSTIAQSYIPASGSSSCYSFSKAADELVPPDKHSTSWALAQQMGYDADVVYDAIGRAQTWRMRPRLVRHGEIHDYVRSLGYEPSSSGVAWLKNELVRIPDAAGQMKPTFQFRRADWNMQGRLFILSGFRSMRFANIAEAEGDLTNVQYHELGLFRELEAQGFDGVVINDFAQTENWGNLGHLAFGFFAAAARRLSFTSIPAIRYEFGPQPSDLNAVDTPELAAFDAQQSVLNEHARDQQIQAPIGPRRLSVA